MGASHAARGQEHANDSASRAWIRQDSRSHSAPATKMTGGGGRATQGRRRATAVGSVRHHPAPLGCLSFRMGQSHISAAGGSRLRKPSARPSQSAGGGSGPTRGAARSDTRRPGLREASCTGLPPLSRAQEPVPPHDVCLPWVSHLHAGSIPRGGFPGPGSSHSPLLFPLVCNTV